MTFNRDRNKQGFSSSSRPGGGGFRSRPSFGGRPKFGDRSDRGPVEMHKAICDNCGRECEVPFRPTSGKPIFCSSCFENKQSFSSNKREGGDSRRPEGRSFERSEDRPMFDATCADCGNKCSVPFRPSSDKPVFCSNCFGEKKHAGGNSGGVKDNFEELSIKLDNILKLLENQKPAKKTKTTPAKEE